MNMISTTQAAKNWGITKDRVLKLAKANRIPGVVQIGSRWLIPSNTPKPKDARYKSYKTSFDKNAESLFRFPTFEFIDTESIYPPLSHNELLIKQMSEKVYTCKFDEAEELLNQLLKEKLNRYEYLTILRAGCYIYIYLNKKYEFFDCYEKLTKQLNSDLTRKEELSIILLEINLSAGFDYTSIKSFKLKPDYKYHHSFLSHLAAVCTVSLNFSSTNELSEKDLVPYEFMCSDFEDKNCLVDLQTIHYYLGITYGLMNIQDKMNYHITRALELAYKYNLYYTPSVTYYYVKKMIDPILDTFPNEFVTKFKTISDKLYEKYSMFTKSISLNNINVQLNSNDYIFIYYAIYHYSNKEVAHLLNISESNVGKRYSAIYETLGVNSKQELIDYYNSKVDNNHNKKVLV